MVTGSAVTSWVMALANRRSKKRAAAGWKRSSSPCGVIGVPRLAAVWAMASRVAWGSASQVKTTVWAKTAPVSLEARRTNPVCWASCSAVVVKRVCKVRASCGTVVMGSPFRPSGLLTQPILRGRLPFVTDWLDTYGSADPAPLPAVFKRRSERRREPFRAGPLPLRQPGAGAVLTQPSGQPGCRSANPDAVVGPADLVAQELPLQVLPTRDNDGIPADIPFGTAAVLVDEHGAVATGRR